MEHASLSPSIRRIYFESRMRTIRRVNTVDLSATLNPARKRCGPLEKPSFAFCLEHGKAPNGIAQSKPRATVSRPWILSIPARKKPTGDATRPMAQHPAEPKPRKVDTSDSQAQIRGLPALLTQD